jgi:hypothetical protein
MAEADGNRTRLAEMLGHNGFEDRAHHQTRYASVASLSGWAVVRRTRFDRSGAATPAEYVEQPIR